MLPEIQHRGNGQRRRDFAATGVTDGSLLDGVKFSKGRIETHTVIMRAATKTVRWLRTQHRAAKVQEV